MIYEEVRGDVLSTHADYYLHACNCMGVWGAGIAASFRYHFPEAYARYREECKYRAETLLGESAEFGNVFCLYTSVGCGESRSSEDLILSATKDALIDLRERLRDKPEQFVIAAPRFNSGLFGVPWHKTRALIIDIFAEEDVTWRIRYL